MQPFKNRDFSRFRILQGPPNGEKRCEILGPLYYTWELDHVTWEGDMCAPMLFLAG